MMLRAHCVSLKKRMPLSVSGDSRRVPSKVTRLAAREIRQRTQEAISEFPANAMNGNG